MRRFPLALTALLAVAQMGFAQESIRERIEWANIWVTDAAKDDLPRVLFIGDSITMGYFGGVEKHLAGKAHCARLATSKCVSDPAFLDEVLLLLKQYRFDVIHFNNGLHGWGYTEARYRDGLVKLIETFKKHAPGARLIWATSTPVRRSDNLRQFGQRNERVKQRNRLAAEIVRQHEIPTNDLFRLVEPHPEFSAGDGVHYNAQGRAAQAKQVAQNVSSCLGAAEK